MMPIRVIPAGVMLAAVCCLADVHYVNVNNPSPVAPYTNWATAAQEIQSAIDAATDGDTVLVTNGVYRSGGAVTPGAIVMTSRVVIASAVTVKSVEGSAVTVIEGSGSNAVGLSGVMRGAYLNNGAALIGFTITNGCTLSIVDWPNRWGGGVLIGGAGTVSNCVFRGNAALYGGAAASISNGLFVDCVIEGNDALYDGGGVYLNQGGVVQRSLVSGNVGHANGGGVYCGGGGVVQQSQVSGNRSGGNGGGVYSFNGTLVDTCAVSSNSAENMGGGVTCFNNGTVQNCVVSSNDAFIGGGVHIWVSGTVVNCTLSRNRVTDSGGGISCFHGVIRNCTLMFNSSVDMEGGVSALSSVMENCIVVGNAAQANPNWSVMPNTRFSHCCATPLMPGEGNITNDPILVSTTHISSNSPCAGAGDFSVASGTDIDGEPWRNPPAIGCDEVHVDALTGSLAVAVGAVYTVGVVGTVLDFTGDVDGRPTANMWSFGDGATIGNTLMTRHAWAAPGTYAVTLTAYNNDHPAGIAATVMVAIVSIESATLYVNRANTSSVYPYATWATAATNIQDAVDAATVTGIAGSHVLVTNGVYDTGVWKEGIVCGSSNRVFSAWPLLLQSVNGPADTVIVGDVASATRCVYMWGGVLEGFTLSNGYATSGCGGLTADGGAVVSNCVITANYSGGVWYGTLYDCVIRGNSAVDGAGVAFCTLYRCEISGNVATGSGGGAYDATLFDCSISGNSARYGGGACGSFLADSTLSGNSAQHGGGGFELTLSNCTVSGNYASQNGGGVHNSELHGCVVHGNRADINGGGVLSCVAGDSVICSNSAPMGGGMDQGVAENCIISGNSANDGGGVCGGILTNCTISGNRASNGGGVGYDSGGGGASSLYRCMIKDNRAEWHGGGANVAELDTCTISGNQAAYGGGAYQGTGRSCLVSNNSATVSGGGLSAATFANSMVVGNVAVQDGGGADNGGMYNCAVFANTAGARGGGVYMAGFQNCTISGNRAAQGGGTYACWAVFDSIVWGNAADTDSNWHDGGFVSSCTLPLPDGTGNISNDPLFVCAPSNNYRLADGSPCINAGTNSLAAGNPDLDGKPRIIAGIVDMGAYEAFYTTTTLVAPNVTAPFFVPSGTTGVFHTVDLPGVTLSGDKQAGCYAAAPWMTNDVRQVYDGMIWTNQYVALGVSESGSTNVFAFRCVSNDMATYSMADTMVVIINHRAGDPFVDITNNAAVVSFDVTEMTVSGTNNCHVIGGMWWTNALNGACGDVQVTGDRFQVTGVPLAVGVNDIWVHGTNLTGVATNDHVAITRGGVGTGAPFIAVTGTPPAMVEYHGAACILAGTNNLQVVGSVWWTNLTAGPSGIASRSPGSNAWSSTVAGLAEGDNVIRIAGSNLWNQLAAETVTLYRVRENELPSLNPLTNAFVREHQVLRCQLSGRTNITAVQCDTADVQGQWCFDTNTWRFSCVPAFGTASQVWQIAFVGLNAYGAETQTWVVTVSAPTKKISVKTPLLFEDEDGDLLSIKYSGVKKGNSAVLFDGLNLAVTNAVGDGTLSFAISRNKLTGNGGFALYNLAMDNNCKSMSLGVDVDNVTMPSRTIGTLKFSGKLGNVQLYSAQTISGGKGLLVGTMAVTNGFETMMVATISGARIFAGLGACANPTNTPATAGFGTIKATLMYDSLVAGKEWMERGSVVSPVIKVKQGFNSTFFRTRTDNLIEVVPIGW